MEALLAYFEELAMHIPLELVALIGTFIEEVISPLPSFIVLVPAGAAARLQGFEWWYLGVLAFFSGVGRVAGGLVLYWIADKSEDVVLKPGRRLFGISHEQIEKFGQRLGKSGKRDWMLLFLMNATPIFPTAVLSLACGFVKVRLRMFITATFFGTLINAAIYLGIGYGGSVATGTLRGLETATQILTGGLVLGLAAWLWHKRHTAVATKRRAPRRTAKTKKGPRK